MAIRDGEYLLSEDYVNGRKHVRVLDKETGDVVSQYYEEARSKPSGRPQKPLDGREAEFMKVYRTNLLDVCHNRRLTFNEAGVLMHLLSFVSWESNFLVNPKTKENISESEMADYLKCDRSTLHDALTALNDKGMISIVKRGNGRPNHFLFNSHIAFFGKYMKDLNEHTVFGNVAYEPPVRIKYKEPPTKT